MSIELFLLHALLAGVGVALITGPLGCFVAWRRLAYFGDAVAHAALLGVAISLVFSLHSTLGIMAVALMVAWAVHHLAKGQDMAFDTLLGLFAHGALALGLVVIALSPAVTVDVNGLLFGDLLAVSGDDVILIYAVAILIMVWMVVRWRDLMRLTLHPDIAQVEGVAVHRLSLMLMLAIAAAVALAIKIVGIVLITSMLIVPAAAVRAFARTPAEMAVYATLAGIASVLLGLYASLTFDTPAGPSIVLAGLTMFLFSRLYALSR